LGECGRMIEVSKAAIIAAYELLRTQRPFIGWKLPEPDDVEFVVIRTRNVYADCDGEVIRVSASRHGQLNTLLATVAHEMIHLHQMRTKLETPNTEHNKDWHKRATRVCRMHGWDRKTF
jgi:hypothetical protein